jgi:GH15 family glucan-1,4-alpha-glucosidase
MLRSGRTAPAQGALFPRNRIWQHGCHQQLGEFSMAKLIEDYGMIGDGETAALVQRNGSIDWLCWPRFDSDACFAALLGTAEHGCWKIAPAGAYESDRRYQSDTLILETDHKSESGTVRVVDFMPIRENGSVLIRIVTGLNGKVSLRNALNLKFNYGQMLPWLEVEGTTAIAHAGPDIVRLQSPIGLTLERDGGHRRLRSP